MNRGMKFYKESSDKHAKQWCNIDFAISSTTILANTQQKQHDSKIILLDNENLESCKWIHSLSTAPINPENIIVPNYGYAEFKRMKMINKKMNLATLHYQYLNDVLENISTSTVSAIWMDYCCTFEGNKYVNPKEDLTLLFEKNLMQDCSVLAITVCTRSIGSKVVNYICDFITGLATKHGFILANATPKLYKSMVYFRWNLIKAPTLLRSLKMHLTRKRKQCEIENSITIQQQQTKKRKKSQEPESESIEPLKKQKNQYYFEKILSKKSKQGKNWYLIKWDGFSSNENTWEPEENIPKCFRNNFT